MTRRRRLPLVSRVCIGVFLLLFSAVAADTIKGPSTTLEKLRSIEPDATEKNRTILNKISTNEAELTSSESDEINGTSDENKKDLEGIPPSDVGRNAKKQDEEKVATSSEKDLQFQGIRSHDQAERSSISDSTVEPRFEESLYGTSGKSSSTKAISEDVYRLPRTNGLTTVTTKPGLEEFRVEEKRNKTTASSAHQAETDPSYRQANGTAKLVLEDTAEAAEGRRETGAKDSSRSELNGKPGSRSANIRLESEKESGDNREDGEKERREDFATKNSEVSDLEKVDGKKENGDAISLINDTDVNYNHYYKTTTDKSPEASTGNESVGSENGTNFISEDSGVSHDWQDPKEEVEVVRNVTHSPIQRFVDLQIQNSRVNQEPGAKKSLNREDELNDEAENDEASPRRNSTELNESGGKIDRSKLMETAVGDNGTINDHTRNPQTSSSPVPRGRTIAFSGINEFSSVETKTTAASREIDAPLSKKNISSEKTTEQKPYPYAKPPKEPITVGNSSDQLVDRTTEETSAYENTIGRGQSEKKFVVTEPSVVIENSIQQFKPAFHHKSDNQSSNNFTTQSTVSMTTVSTITLGTIKPTNEAVADPAGDPRSTVKPEEKSTSAGNDVPLGSAGREVITGKENFDVTGNGITEVTSEPGSPDNADKRVNEGAYGSSFHTEIANRTTGAPLITDTTEKSRAQDNMATNFDVQTNAEESLLIRSTLNVTEVSTEYPLTGNFSEGEKSTTVVVPTLNSSVVKTSEDIPMNPTIVTNFAEETSTINATVTPKTIHANGTNEIPSGMSVTLNPDESSLPTTTGVEYEFVGLSEATVFPSQNTTDEISEEVSKQHAFVNATSTISVPTVQDLGTKNSSDERTTINPETITDISSIGETEVTNTDDELSTTPVMDQTIVPTSIPSPRVSKEDSTVVASVVDEKTEGITVEEENERTTTMIDSFSTISDEDVVTTTDEAAVASKDSHFASNVTESSVTTDSVSISNVMTDTTEIATSIPSAPTGLIPRILVSSTSSTPSTSSMPTERTMDVSVMPLSPDEITSLVRIVMKGTWQEVCPQMDNVRSTLAEILTSGMNKSVHANQIMIHQNPCTESRSAEPTETDVPLTSILVYVVDENRKFDSSMTNILPSLYNKSRVDFPVPIHSFLLVQETDSGNAIAVIVVSSIAFICLVLLTGLLFIMRKRQTRFNYGERCRPVSLDAYSLDSVSAYNSVRRKGAARSSKRSYGNPTFEDSSVIPSHPLNFAALSSFCNDVNAINEEFAGIPQVSAKIDELPAGAELKNRYANVIPLPETRVPLQKVNNDPLTEYINANYVRGLKNAIRYYIACQGPMESTVTDFWRMIWEQQSKVIIMLTDLVENGVEKCTEYIPPSEITDCHRLYGDYQVTLKKRETKEKYAISTLHLKNLENNTYREVYHIWYLWPVNGVQSDGAGLIAVLLEARALQRGGPGPIVVHCSPGTGRTGTLIALDLGIRQYEITRTVDVPRVVYIIRRDRAGAVQTKEQYAFIYKALNLYATKLAGGVLEST